MIATLTVRVITVVGESALVKVSVTVYKPGLVYVCITLKPLPGEPSPKSQKKLCPSHPNEKPFATAEKKITSPTRHVAELLDAQFDGKPT